MGSCQICLGQPYSLSTVRPLFFAESVTRRTKHRLVIVISTSLYLLSWAFEDLPTRLINSPSDIIYGFECLFFISCLFLEKALLLLSLENHHVALCSSQSRFRTHLFPIRKPPQIACSPVVPVCSVWSRT